MSRKIDIEWIRDNNSWIYLLIFLFLLSSCTPYDPQPGDKNPPNEFCSPALLSHSPECIEQMLQLASGQENKISAILAMDNPIVIGVVTAGALIEPSPFGEIVVLTLITGGSVLIANGSIEIDVASLINNSSISFSQEFAKRYANLGLSAFLAYSVVKNSDTIAIKAAPPEKIASLDMEISKEHLPLILELASKDPQLLFDMLGSYPTMTKRLEEILGSAAADYEKNRGHVPSGLPGEEAEQDLATLVGTEISALSIDRIKTMNSTNPRTIILVEDDGVPATIIHTLLTSLGFKVDHYHNCDDYYARKHPYGMGQVLATIFDWDYLKTKTGKLSDIEWTTNESCLPELRAISKFLIVFTGRTQATSEMGSEPILYKNYSQLFQRLLRLILDTLAEQEAPDLKKQFVDNRELRPRPDLKSLLACNMVNGNPVHSLMNHDEATPDGTKTWKF